jgi:hypothetical protein
MADRQVRLEEARRRALIITQHIRGRADVEVRKIILSFSAPLDFEGRLEDLAIAPEAWAHIGQAQIDPKLVFAHPDLLQAHPQTSLHYRGISTLSLKRVQMMVGAVDMWEDGNFRRPPDSDKCLRVARVYNAVISVIITGTDGWTLENGYRNILATIGITEDGALRNLVGQEGETAVKERISEWLAANDAISIEVQGTTTLLGEGNRHRMVYGSEPDIKFEQRTNQGAWEIVSTVEIKSGTDPAGALERLGAIQKSFEQTPARSRNFAVLGIVTDAMRQRLDALNVARDFLLYDILNDPAEWEDFATEIFHHTLRVV